MDVVCHTANLCELLSVKDRCIWTCFPWVFSASLFVSGHTDMNQKQSGKGKLIIFDYKRNNSSEECLQTKGGSSSLKLRWWTSTTLDGPVLTWTQLEVSGAHTEFPGSFFCVPSFPFPPVQSEAAPDVVDTVLWIRRLGLWFYSGTNWAQFNSGQTLEIKINDTQFLFSRGPWSGASLFLVSVAFWQNEGLDQMTAFFPSLLFYYFFQDCLGLHFFCDWLSLLCSAFRNIVIHWACHYQMWSEGPERKHSWPLHDYSGPCDSLNASQDHISLFGNLITLWLLLGFQSAANF